MSSDPSNNQSDLPPWLRDVPLPPRPRDLAAPGDQPQPGPEAQSARLPAWLGESTTPPSQPAPSADLPDWLVGEPPAPAQTSGNQDSLPSWLRDIADTPAQPEPPAAGPPPSPAGEGQLPGWLRDTQEAAPSALPEELPDWLRDIAGLPADQAAETSGPAQTRADASESAPAWPRDSEQAGPPAGTPTPPQPASHDELDSSLEPFSFDEPPSMGPAAQEGSLPAWLGSADNEGGADAAMPGWLNDTGNQPTGPAPKAQASDEPDWLKGLDAQTPAARDSATGQPDVPLWLQDIERQPADLDAADLPAAPPEEPAAGPGNAEGLPSWLQDVEAGQADTGTAPSWLQETPAAPQPGADQPATPAPEAETLPSWLQEATGGPPAHEAPAGELPSWLQETPTAPQSAQPAPAAETPGGENLPAWLRDTAAALPDTGSLPAWLQDTTDTSPAPETPAAAQAAPESTPAWPQESPSDQPAQEPPAGDLPSWLQSTPADQPAEVSAGAEAAEAADQDTLPEWLRPAAAPQTPPAAGAAQDIPPWLRDEAGQPLPTAGDASLPAWLRGASIDQSQASTSGPPQAPSASESAPSSFDWFEDEAAPALPEPTASAPANELVGGIELPAWLRPPEPEQPKELNPTDARSLDWLTRLGGPEEEEGLTTTIAPATKLRPPSTPARTQAQIEALGLLQRLAAQPYPEIEPIEAAPAPSIWRRFGVERLLYLLLLLALVVGLALPLSGTLGLNTPPTAPGAQDLFAQIDTLTPNDTVLVGYEWDARRSGELRPLEQAVLGHLIQRHVKLVLVSTDAQGTLLLFDLRDELGAAGYRPSGEDYILLGYKPGAELALRSLAQDFRGALRSDFQGNDATLSGLATDASGQPRLNSLADFAVVLVLADEPADVQGWMEQVRTSARKADGSYVPFDFVLPAETAPIVQPYLSQPGIYHLAGKQGALAYQQLRGQSDAGGQIAGEAGQQRMSLLIYVVLFLAGAVVVGLSGAVARGRRRQ